MRPLQFPEVVRETLARRYRNRHRSWLAVDDDGEWPLELTLGCPTEQEALRQLQAVQDWITAWQSWHGAGEIRWCERQWRTLGTQRLPERIVLHTAMDVALWLAEQSRWQRASQRYARLIERWPALATILPRYFDVLADYGDDDFGRLEAMVAWIEAHPRSNLYPRQLPISGLDSKWLEGRKSLVGDLVAGIQMDGTDGLDFFERCGLRQAPHLLRLRVLDPELRRTLGGLADITAPLEDLARLDLPVSSVFIVENLQTGLAFGDLTDSVVFMRLGYAVDVLARIPWVARADCIYWGDMDTHGFAILSRARSHLPRLRSILMDEATLHAHRPLWVEEPDPHPATALPFLVEQEQKVFLGIKEQRWGKNVRLEQERIDWAMAWTICKDCLDQRD